MSGHSFISRLFSSDRKPLAPSERMVEAKPVRAEPAAVEFVEVCTKDLAGAGLAWAVMTADGWTCSKPRKLGFRHDFARRFDCENATTRLGYTPSPCGEFARLLHKHAVALEPSDPWVENGNNWQAMCVTVRDDSPHSFHFQFGQEPVTACLRAIVGAILGETVSIPAVLME